MDPDRLTGGEPNEVGNTVAKLKELRDLLTQKRSRTGQLLHSAKPTEHPPSTPEPEQSAPDSTAPAGGGTDFVAEEPDIDYRLLFIALRDVLVREFGASEDERWLALAFERYEQL